MRCLAGEARFGEATSLKHHQPAFSEACFQNRCGGAQGRTVLAVFCTCFKGRVLTWSDEWRCWHQSNDPRPQAPHHSQCQTPSHDCAIVTCNHGPFFGEVYSCTNTVYHHAVSALALGAWMKQLQEVQMWRQVRGPAGAVMCETRDLGIKMASLAHIDFQR